MQTLRSHWRWILFPLLAVAVLAFVIAKLLTSGGEPDFTYPM